MAVRRLEELDLATAVVARALLSELGGTGNPDSGRPLEQTVVVTPEQLLAYGAVRQACRYVDDVEEFLRRQVTALREVTFWSSLDPALPGAPPARFDEVALFNIVEVREWSDTDADANGAAVHWMVRGGLWAGSHLRQACRGPLCRIARASLEPEQETASLLVLRIGSLAMGGACPGGAREPIRTTVEALLTAVGRLPGPQLRTAAWGQRTADDLCDAARALLAVGLFDSVDTPGLPSDGDVDSGALACWLKTDTTFTFAAVIG